jgi:hypothetical protein
MNFPSWYNAQMRPLKQRHALKFHRNTELQSEFQSFFHLDQKVLYSSEIQIQYTTAMNTVCSSSCSGARPLIRGGGGNPDRCRGARALGGGREKIIFS